MWHLCSKQAQPKMCRSPKVYDGVDITKKYLECLFFDIYFLRTLNCHHTHILKVQNFAQPDFVFKKIYTKKSVIFFF